MRLVIGDGAGMAAAIDGPARALCGDPAERDALRDAGVRVSAGDPTDPDAVAAAAGDGRIGSVLVVDDRPERVRSVVAAARAAYPDAALVVRLPPDCPADDRAAIRAVADRTIDATTAVADRVLDAAASDAGVRSARLRRTLRGVDDPLAIVTHDNPDPDAIASGIALERIATTVGLDAAVHYGGGIAHQENRALVNVLGLDLRELDAADPDSFGGVALVDHARPGVNDGLSPETSVDVVIDHHPPRGAVAGRFVDVRVGAGATSTILVDHCRRLDVSIDTALATALRYGIRVDTDDFRRETGSGDFEAAAAIEPLVDWRALDRIASPSTAADTLETIAAAVRERRVDGGVVTSFVGRIGNRDAIAQAADRLLALDGIEATLVAGVVDGAIVVSCRGRGSDIDLGETLRIAFDRIGDAGGHVDIAGAQIPLGVFDTVDDLSRDGAGDFVRERFFEALRSRPTDRPFGAGGRDGPAPREPAATDREADDPPVAPGGDRAGFLPPAADTSGMYDRILVPTDGSEGFDSVLDEALGLADLTGATVHGLYVVDTRDYNTLPEAQWLPVAEELEAAGEEALDVVRDRADEAGVDVTATVERGVPHAVIVDYAADESIDLIVMGTHGRSGIDRFLLGSVAEKVLRSAAPPVMTVRIDG